MLDTLAPDIQDAGVQSGTPGANGWYVSAVSNRFTASDTGSGLDPACASAFPKNVSTGSGEGTAVTVSSGACSDLAGNTNPGISSASFKIDLTDPIAILAVTAGTPGANGWYTSDVTVTTSGIETVSGPLSARPTSTRPARRPARVFNGSCTNQAGLTHCEPADREARQDRPLGDAHSDAGTQEPTAGSSSDVTVKTTGADAISGPVDLHRQTRRRPTETAGQSFNGSCTNQAGLIGNATSLDRQARQDQPVGGDHITGGWTRRSHVCDGQRHGE